MADNQLGRLHVAARQVAWLLPPTLYLMGFLSWTLYARQFDAGFLPVRTAQYVAAGAIGVTYGAGPLMAALWLHQCQQRRIRAGNNMSTGTFFVALISAGIGLAAWTLLAITIGALNMMDDSEFLLYVGVGVSSIALLLMVATLAAIAAAPNREERMWPARAFLVLAAAGLSLSAMDVVVMENATAEFGGGAPRAAILEIEAENLSEETREWLGISREASGVVRTMPVTVAFHNEDIYVLQAQGKGDIGGLVHVSRITLPAESIMATVWIDCLLDVDRSRSVGLCPNGWD